MDKPIMTKYEYTRIKGIRIQQLIDGMNPFVDIDEDEQDNKATSGGKSVFYY